MRTRTWPLLAVVVAVSQVGGCSESVPGPTLITCAGVSQWTAEGVEIVSSDPVAGDAPAHCKVAGVIDGSIHFELLLPDEWNGEFVMGGGGGFVGSVQNHAESAVLPEGPVAGGYATVGTDTGHTGSMIDASWALDNPEAEVNFGHRAIHRTAETAEAIIADFYGSPSTYSYFVGCSRGGGQAMVSAQRYPGDFDGILASAPAMDWPGLGAGQIQTQQAIYPDPDDLDAPVITADNRALLERELLAECDTIDGVQDGVLDDPRACPFDPEGLPRCAVDAPGAECVTEAQLRAIQSIYGGPLVDGEHVFPGFAFGGENEPGGWDVWITGAQDAMGPGNPSLHFAFGTQMYKYLIFDDPDWDYSTYDFANWADDTAAMGALLNSTDPDLGEFRDLGGKLILTHGWSDPALTPLGSIQYYEAAEELDADLRDYFRLFLMPGVLHCTGGPGPDQADFFGALERWVQRGVAPESIDATKRDEDGGIVRTRPLCPYPLVAVYDGAGDPDQAASFACGTRG